ncbi:MAG: AAA family ATPase [Elusimicrobia bacterium]|nr:AAA family ATPase [Elusimicrobiota bacterium]
MTRFEEQILNAIRGRQPLIYLHTSEEERAADSLGPLVAQCFPGGSVTTWSCVRGLEPAPEGGDTRDPLAALQQIIKNPRPGFYVMKDLPAFFDDPKVTRALREAYFVFCREFKSCVILVSPSVALPETLEKEVCFVELDAPSPEELLAVLLQTAKEHPAVRLTAGVQSQIVLALRGLTLKEAGHVLHRTFGAGAGKGKVLDEIFAEKEALAKKAGYLEFVPVKFDVSRIGGLENVKEWAAQRKSLFNEEAVKAGIPIPKGILMMGVSGCGKSLLAKAIAGLWKVPLFRLDMSLVFSGAYGSPETAFNKALRTIESVAPVVLWIDEMEASLSTPKEAASSQSMTFSAFLTWMQEKPPLVFVAATANRIESLPAEIIRKGRFDQVFFCDLPGKEEREQILSIHLELNGAHPGDFDMGRLVYRMEGWSGAEIEQAVIAARIDAHQTGRDMTFEDVRRQCDGMVPLSKTMAAQVKAIRDWAHDRATRASKLVTEAAESQ